MDKLKMHSPDMTEQNIDKLLALFPNCKTEKQNAKGELENAIDFDLLKQELSKNIVEGPQERYQLNWPGKKEALLTANAPIAKTLRPCRDESVDFDTTENLFIEGDNLDALKLLQETYLGKVKMIYIDPPYNTGKDFIYNDDFSETSEEYLLGSEQRDEEGNRLIANMDSNGRFHSDWLSMLYSRISIARRLLTEDGVIFLSIDDAEQANLRKLCDEVFGADNFVANIIWQKKYAASNDAKYLSDVHDFILCYCKNKQVWRPNLFPRPDELNNKYKNPDNDPRGPWYSTNLSVKTYSEKNDYVIISPAGIEFRPPASRAWVVSKEKFDELLQDNRIWFGKDGTSRPYQKKFLTEVQQGIVPTTLWLHEDAGHNIGAKSEVRDLFKDESNLFDTPKPTKLIYRLIELIEDKNNKSSIYMDFFAGSGTTAHSVLKRNADELRNDKYVLIQLDEPISDKGGKTGYKTIADISKERIRRAGEKIKADSPETTDLDIGFRVLKIDSSNMNEVHYTPDALNKNDLFNQVEHIKDDRSAEDLLFQVMLDWGVDLSLPISKQSIEGKDVYFVNDSGQHLSEAAPCDLAACFEKDIDEALIKTLAAKAPLRVVFRDDGFGSGNDSDSVKINVEQIFKQLAPATDIKVI